MKYKSSFKRMFSVAFSVIEKHLVILPVVVVICLQSCEESRGIAPEFQRKDKTLLVYMVANNNLSSNAVSNLSGIKKGFVPNKDRGNIVVYYHVPNNSPLLLNIVKDETGKVKVDTSYRFPSRNSATAASLRSAMQVTATMFPADEYGLVLWSHGTGWLPVGYYNNNPAASSYSNEENPNSVQYGNSFCSASLYDDGIDPYADMVKMVYDTDACNTKSFGSENGVEMNITEIVSAFPYKLSFVIFDACLMGGIETAYQLKDSTDYILFSPAEVLSEGLPYDKIMQHIFSSPTDLESVAKEYYLHYNSLSGSSRAATISLVKTSELENVAAVAKEIFAVNREKISTIRMNNIQRYFRGNKYWFYDLNDFISNIGTAEQVSAFSQALSNAVVYKAATPYFIDIPITKYSGISTYVPNPFNEELATFYMNLEWNKACEMIVPQDSGE